MELIRIKSKTVTDPYDGFQTDYTMYYCPEADVNTNTNTSTDAEPKNALVGYPYIFVLCDNEIYTPGSPGFCSAIDWQCDSREEAEEWFDDYTGEDGGTWSR